MIEQRVQQRVAPGLDGQRDRPAATAFAQLLEPSMQGFGCGFDRSVLDAVRAGDLPGKRMRLVSPIQGHEGRVVIVVHDRFGFGGTGLQVVSCEASATPVAEYAWPFPMPSDRRRVLGSSSSWEWTHHSFCGRSAK